MDPLVFVYGTLKRDEHNAFIMEKANARFVGRCLSPPRFTMIDLGFYPAVLSGGTTAIHGEVYEVSTMRPLDDLEGYPGYYDRMEVDTPFGLAWMYFQIPSYGATKYPIIPTGEWTGKNRRRLSEYHEAAL